MLGVTFDGLDEQAIELFKEIGKRRKEKTRGVALKAKVKNK